MIRPLSGLILEGISGSGKSTALRAMCSIERDAMPLSRIVLSEHQTQRVLERRTGLTAADHIALLDQHVAYLEGLQERLVQTDWCRPDQRNHRVTFVLERFHLTHVVQNDYVGWDHVTRIDERLGGLGARLVLLTADPQTLGHRLFHGRDPQWMTYVSRFGDTPESIVDAFVARQDAMLGLTHRTACSVEVIDTSNCDASVVAKRMLDMLESQSA